MNLELLRAGEGTIQKVIPFTHLESETNADSTTSEAVIRKVDKVKQQLAWLQPF